MSVCCAKKLPNSYPELRAGYTMEWIKYKKAPGIFYREHPDRAVKINARAKDRYWRLFYRYEGKIQVEPLGWESEGWTEQKVTEISAALAGNRKAKTYPSTFAELKAMNAEAQAAAREEAAAKAQAAAREETAKITFKEVFELYLQDRIFTVDNPRTLADEKGKGYKRLVPFFGHVAMTEINGSHVELLIRECLKPSKAIKENGKKKPVVPKPLKAGTIKHHINLMAQVWEFGRKKGFYAGENPSRTKEISAATPKETFHRLRFLTKEEAKILLPLLKVRSVQLWAKCSVILYTGLRPVEVHKLTWSDIDKINKIVKVKKEKDSNKGKSRVVPYPAQLEAVFDEIRPESLTLSDLVFPPKSIRVRKTEGQQRSGEISDVFEKVIESLGWNHGVDARDKIVPYSLRHTYASWLVQNGIDLYKVAELIGHSTIEVTKRYAHLAPQNLRAAVDKTFEM